MINLIDSLKSVKRTSKRIGKINNRYRYYLSDLEVWKDLSMSEKSDASHSFYDSIHKINISTGLVSLETFTTSYSTTGDHQAGPQLTYVQLLETHLQTGQVLSYEEFTLFCLFCGFTNKVTSGKKKVEEEDESENRRIIEAKLKEGKPFKYTHMFDKYDQGNIVVTHRVKRGNGYSRDLEDYSEFLPLRESLILPNFYEDLVNSDVLTFEEFDEKLDSSSDAEYNVLTLGVVE